MGVMTTLPQSRPLSVADFEALREQDDGHRYELVDGALIVTPSPIFTHQRAVVRLVRALDDTVWEGCEVFVAPLDVRIGDNTVLQPDVLVARAGQLFRSGVREAPLLAVEVLSPSTRHIDLGLKRSRYEAAGCASYWVVDPDEPSLHAWELGSDGYGEGLHVVGDETADLEAPWPVHLVPADLVAPPRSKQR
jgi:Uma2 family endonuclease